MKNLIGFMFFAFIIGGLTSCEGDLLGVDEIDSEEELAGITGGLSLSTGCDMYINGSFENGSAETAAFTNNKVGRWGGAYGTADRWDDYDGIQPYSGDWLGHMQRYKGNDTHYESIFLKMPIKTQNSYCLNYRMRGGDLALDVYLFDDVEQVNINSLIPNYINDLGSPGFSFLHNTSGLGDIWQYSEKSFTNRSGRLVFIPSSSTQDNPNRMLLDDVQLTCEYGYLTGIYGDLIQSTMYGYDYQFDAEIDESNSNLSYLWTFSYLNGGFSSQSKAPVVNFPFPITKPYKVEVCLILTDVDGCCVEECAIITIGNEITPPPPTADSICNYSICLETWLLSCNEGSSVHVSTSDGWQSLTFYDDYKEILDKIVDGMVTGEGYDPVNTRIIQTDDCKVLYVVECSPVPISIAYACINVPPAQGESLKQQLKLAIFDSDCKADCEDNPK